MDYLWSAVENHSDNFSSAALKGEMKTTNLISRLRFQNLFQSKATPSTSSSEYILYSVYITFVVCVCVCVYSSVCVLGRHCTANLLCNHPAASPPGDTVSLQTPQSNLLQLQLFRKSDGKERDTKNSMKEKVGNVNEYSA